MAAGIPDRAFFNSSAMIDDGRQPVRWQEKRGEISEEVEKINGADLCGAEKS